MFHHNWCTYLCLKTLHLQKKLDFHNNSGSCCICKGCLPFYIEVIKMSLVCRYMCLLHKFHT
jgi:hypothetical protein